MFRWLWTSMFGGDDAPPPLTPGTSVLREADGLVGVLSTVQEREGVPCARVVFSGHRSTWVEWVALDGLRLVGRL